VCAGFGHKRNSYTRHEFWGDWERVVRCLRDIDAMGFDKGRVGVARKLRGGEQEWRVGLRREMESAVWA
jgi:hypothetical protein